MPKERRTIPDPDSIASYFDPGTRPEPKAALRGLGGDPTNPASQGIPPAFGRLGGAEPNGLRYVYPRRSDPNSGIDYHLELTTNLVSGVWTNAGYEIIGTGTLDSEFDAVTNRIPTGVDDERYIRLIVEEKLCFNL